MEEGMCETKKCKCCGKDINISYTVCPLCGAHLKDDILSAVPEYPRYRARLRQMAFTRKILLFWNFKRWVFSG